MSKHILVCLPISAEQRIRIEAVRGFAYRFTAPDTATVEDACGQMPCWQSAGAADPLQNDHLVVSVQHSGLITIWSQGCCRRKCTS